MVRVTTRTLGTTLVALGLLALGFALPGGLLAHSPNASAPLAPVAHVGPLASAGNRAMAVVHPHGGPSGPVNIAVAITSVLPGSNPLPVTVAWSITMISGANLTAANVSASLAAWSTASTPVLVANETLAITDGVASYTQTIDYAYLSHPGYQGGNFPGGAYRFILWATVMNSSNASVAPLTNQSNPLNTALRVIDIAQSFTTAFATYMATPLQLNFTQSLAGNSGITPDGTNVSVSVEIRFIQSGCGSQFGFGGPCESIANISLGFDSSNKYSMNVDGTNLSQNHFANGQFPEGQYQLIVWGSVMNSSNPSELPRTQAIAQNVYLILSPLNATILAPLANSNLTPGTIPISVSYVGNFINGANVTVSQGSTVVFVQGAFAPGFGTHTATVFWVENYGGQYTVTLTVTTAYTTKSWSEPVTVSSSSGIVYVNHSAYQNTSIIPGVSGAVSGALLLVVGLIIGMIVAFLLARMMWASPAATPAQPWSGSKPTTECSICHQTFATEEEMKEHQKTAHGMT